MLIVLWYSGCQVHLLMEWLVLMPTSSGLLPIIKYLTHWIKLMIMRLFVRSDCAWPMLSHLSSGCLPLIISRSISCLSMNDWRSPVILSRASLCCGSRFFKLYTTILQIERLSYHHTVQDTVKTVTSWYLRCCGIPDTWLCWLHPGAPDRWVVSW